MIYGVQTKWRFLFAERVLHGVSSCWGGCRLIPFVCCCCSKRRQSPNFGGDVPDKYKSKKRNWARGIYNKVTRHSSQLLVKRVMNTSQSFIVRWLWATDAKIYWGVAAALSVWHFGWMNSATGYSLSTIHFKSGGCVCDRLSSSPSPPEIWNSWRWNAKFVSVGKLPKLEMYIHDL